MKDFPAQADGIVDSILGRFKEMPPPIFSSGFCHGYINGTIPSITRRKDIVEDSLNVLHKNFPAPQVLWRVSGYDINSVNYSPTLRLITVCCPPQLTDGELKYCILHEYRHHLQNIQEVLTTASLDEYGKAGELWAKVENDANNWAMNNFRSIMNPSLQELNDAASLFKTLYWNNTRSKSYCKYKYFMYEF